MKILLAIDGSPHSVLAVKQVATQPWPRNSSVEILTVIHPTIPVLTEPTLMLAATSVQQAQELRAVAPRVLDAARKQIARSAPGLTVTTKILDGESIPHNERVVVVRSPLIVEASVLVEWMPAIPGAHSTPAI